MRAVVIAEPGGPEMLRWTEVEDPVAGPDEVLVTAGGDAIRPHQACAQRIDYHVPASGRLILTWE